MKRLKYGNKRTELDGMTFDSKREAARWAELCLLERARKIENLERQVVYVLAPPVKFLDAKRAQPALRIIVDFRYTEDGETVLEDVKSPASITATFTVKRHLLKYLHGMDVRVVA